MHRVVVVGGGFAGCAAAVSAAKAGAAVTLVERTDVLLGNSSMYGGYMNPNGRFVGAEEAKALGAGDLFTALESITLHERVELPGLEGAYTFDACLAEPTIRHLVEDANVTILFKSRAVDVVQDGSRIAAVACQHYGEAQEAISGDVFIDCTGGTGGPAYVPKEKLTPSQAVGLVRHAGGCSVLCHPGVTPITDRSIEELADEGLDALEVHYPLHTPQDEKRLLDLARRIGLLVTGGSDFHGEAKPGIHLGQETVSLVELEALRERAAARL